MRAKKTDLRYVLFLCITKLTIELLSLDYFPLALKSLNKCCLLYTSDAADDPRVV